MKMVNNKIIYGILLFSSIFIIFLFIYILIPFLEIICWAGILGFYLYPVNNFLNKKLKNKKIISSTITIGGFICFIIFPLIFISFIFYYQIANLLNFLSLLFKKDPSSILQDLQSYPILYNFSIKLLAFFEPFQSKLFPKMTDIFSEILRYGLNLVTNLLKKSTFLAYQIALIILTTFYFLIDGEKILCTIKKLFPGEESEKSYILQKISEILKGVLYGTVLTGLVQGALALIIYAALEIPQYLIWTFLTIIASFIPFLGTFLIWGPIVLFLLITESYIKALILFLYSALIVSQVDNILKPFLIGEKAKLHNLLIFFAVLGGLVKFGILGLFLGPIILGLFLCVIEFYKIKILKQDSLDA